MNQEENPKQQQKMELAQFINSHFQKMEKKIKLDQQNIQFLRNAQVKNDKSIEQLMNNQMAQQKQMQEVLKGQIMQMKTEMEKQNQFIKQMVNQEEKKNDNMKKWMEQTEKQQMKHHDDIEMIKKYLGLEGINRSSSTLNRNPQNERLPHFIQEQVNEENDRSNERIEAQMQSKNPISNSKQQPQEYQQSVQFDQSAVLSERQPFPLKQQQHQNMKQSNMLGENLEPDQDFKNSQMMRSRVINENSKQLSQIYQDVKSQDKKELVSRMKQSSQFRNMQEIEEEEKIKGLNNNESQLKSIPLKDKEEQKELRLNYSISRKSNPNDKSIQCSWINDNNNSNIQNHSTPDRSQQYKSTPFKQSPHQSNNSQMDMAQQELYQYLSQNDIISLSQEQVNPCQLKFDNVPQHVVTKFLNNLNQYKSQWVMKQSEMYLRSQQKSNSPQKNSVDSSKQQMFRQFYDEDHDEQLLPQRDEQDQKQGMKQPQITTAFSNKKESQPDMKQSEPVHVDTPYQSVNKPANDNLDNPVQQQKQNSQDEQYIRAFNQSFKDKDSIKIVQPNVISNDEISLQQSRPLDMPNNGSQQLNSQHIRQNDRLQELNDQIYDQLQQQMVDYSNNPNQLPSMHNSQLNSQFLNYPNADQPKEFQQQSQSNRSSQFNMKCSQFTIGSQMNTQGVKKLQEQFQYEIDNQQQSSQQQHKQEIDKQSKLNQQQQNEQSDQVCCNDKCQNKLKNTDGFFLSQQIGKQACNQCKKHELVQKIEDKQKSNKKEVEHNSQYLQQIQNLDSNPKMKNLIDKLENKEKKDLVESLYDETNVDNQTNKNNEDQKNTTQTISNSKVNIQYPSEQKQSIDSYIKEKSKNGS